MASLSASPRSTAPPSPRRRDFQPSSLSSSVWSHGGESYCEQYGTAVGSPGQDLSRFTEGPARYLHGTPNTGSKAMLERNVQLTPRGRFVHGPNTGPAQHTKIVADRKLACKRSVTGPDPYGLCAANLWTPRSSQRALATFYPNGHYLGHGSNEEVRQPWIYGRTRAQAFDPYHVGSRNTWLQTSPSIKSIMAPPMPQTPHGSPLLPVSHRHVNYSQYSRMRQRTPQTAPVSARADLSLSMSRASGNPFH